MIGKITMNLSRLWVLPNNNQKE